MSAYSAPSAIKGALAEGIPASRGLPSHRDVVRLIADRVAPASFFALILAAKGLSAPALLAQAAAADGVLRWKLGAEMAGYGLTSVFMVVIVGLYVFRLSSIRRMMGFWPRSVALGGTVIMFATALAPARAPNVTVALAANLLIAGGLVVTLWGLGGLRRCFGIMPEVRGLVTSGPYRHVRHPMYLGESISALGVTLLALSPLTVSIYMVYLVLQWRRTVYEETILSETLPQYREYRATTKRFVPFVW